MELREPKAAPTVDAHFVDARSEPWINCFGYGGVLDFSAETTAVVM